MRPTDDQLRRFLQGLLSEAEAEAVGRWVESDPSAASVLARLESDDSLADALAEPSTRADQTTPAGAAGHATSPELPAGYRPLGELGRGGMGVVYRAVDEEIDREVAVKVLGPHIRVGSGPEARFCDEARITGQLQHPGIPPVYRVGTLPDGRPFLAMKLIKGDTLAELLRHAPTAVNRLGVFEAICQAVGYAHAHGVIHRDLKPSNVMVGTFGETQVMDWGLAKVLLASGGRTPVDSAEPHPDRPTEIKSLRHSDTQAGSVMGTPAFMSPEQAIGASDRLDRRTDVFGLGGILAVLLTGRPPYVGADSESTRQMAARAKLDDCFARLDGCGAEPDLVALCKRCLSAEPENRPSDGRAVAEAVAALRAAADERARRAEIDRERAVVEGREQRKRQRVLLAAAAAVAAVLLLGLVGTGVGLGWAEANRREAEQAREREKARADGEAEQARLKEEQRQIAETAKGLAETRRHEAEQSKALAEEREEKAEKAYAKAADVLEAMVSGVAGDSLGAQKAITPEQKKFLTEVLTYYREFAAQKGEDRKGRVRVANAAFRVGQIEGKLGRLAEAAKAFRQACDEFDTLIAAHGGTVEFRANLATSHHNLGLVLVDLGQTAEARQEYLTALAIREELAAASPDAAEPRDELADSHNSLGVLYARSGQRAEGVKQVREAVALREKLVADYPGERKYREALARGYGNLGTLYKESGVWKEAEGYHQKAVEVLDQLVAAQPTAEYRASLAAGLNNLGNFHRDRDRPAEADKAYRRALAVRQKLTAEFPAVPQYRYDVATSHNNWGVLLRELGRPVEAQENIEKALAVRGQLVAEFPANLEYRQELAGSHNNLGLVLQEVGKLAEAEKQYRQAVGIYEKLAADHPTIPQHRFLAAGGRINLGTLLNAQGKWAEAEAEYKTAIAGMEKLVADFPTVPLFRMQLGGAYGNLGRTVTAGGKPADAVKWFGKAIDTLAGAREKSPQAATATRLLQDSYWGRAEAHHLSGEFTEALADWDRLLAITPKLEQPQFRAQRAVTQLRLGRTAEAVAEVAEVRMVLGWRWEADTLLDFARVYAVASGKVPDEQKHYADRAMEMLTKAVKAGFKDAARLKADKDFDPLRERDDFKKLLTDLDKK